MRIEPFQLLRRQVNDVVGFLDAVAFAGVAVEDDFDAAFFEGAVILFALLDADAEVAFAVGDHGEMWQKRQPR